MKKFSEYFTWIALKRFFGRIGRCGIVEENWKTFLKICCTCEFFPGTNKVLQKMTNSKENWKNLKIFWKKTWIYKKLKNKTLKQILKIIISIIKIGRTLKKWLKLWNNKKKVKLQNWEIFWKFKKLWILSEYQQNFENI